jgi:hypothetical protein
MCAQIPRNIGHNAFEGYWRKQPSVKCIMFKVIQESYTGL